MNIGQNLTSIPWKGSLDMSTIIRVKMGQAVAKLVDALWYKPEGRGLETRREWIFFQFT
jgi:hypothetical protein